MTSLVSSKELFWSEVEKTKGGLFNSPAGNANGEKAVQSIISLNFERFSECTEIDSFVSRLFSNPPEKVLDLGTGIGANALPLAKAGAHVTAIDISKQLLEKLSERSVEMNCPSSKLRLRRGDITSMPSYGGPFNLVMAIDVLSYIPATTLRSTLEKIHACLEDRGIFIGTLFTEGYPVETRERIRQAGVYLYDNNPQFLVQLLQYSGFQVIELRPSIVSGYSGAYNFRAEKITPPSAELASRLDSI
jgi:ubiquinone/menaquinone biosynthesis C-methylase UbiE